jgi:hypothetical protein
MATPWTQVPQVKTGWGSTDIDLGIGDWENIPSEYSEFNPDDFDPRHAIFNTIGPEGGSRQDWSVNPITAPTYGDLYLHDMTTDDLLGTIATAGLDQDQFQMEAEGMNAFDTEAMGEAQDWLVSNTLQSIGYYGQDDLGIDPQIESKSTTYAGLEEALWAGFSSWEQSEQSKLQTTLGQLGSEYAEEVSNIESDVSTEIQQLKEQKYDSTDEAKAKKTAFEAGKTGLVGGRAYKKIGQEQTFQALSAETIEEEISFAEEQKEIDLQAAADLYEYNVWDTTSQAYATQKEKLIGLETDLLEYKVAFENEAQNVYNQWYSGLGSLISNIGPVDLPGDYDASWNPWINQMGGA